MPDIPNPSQPADELANLRAEIDALDDALHDRLMQRTAIVDRLASSRAKGSSVPLRPGREAIILRRLLARHQGTMPRSAIVRLWREIFATSTAQQGAFAIAAFVPAPGAALARLAREHFGTATPIRNHPTSARTLAAVTTGEAAVAVLPMPEEGEATEGAWWTSLDAPRLQVIARLPFFGPAQPAALVVAPVAADPSGHDRSLLRIDGTAALTRTQLMAALGAAELPPRSVMFRRNGDRVQALVDVDGFVPAADSRLTKLTVGRVLLLGAYAVPMNGE